MKVDPDINVLKILNLDLEINKNIFSNVSFNDSDMEKIYQQNKINRKFVDGDKVILIGWFSTFLYAYFVYYCSLIFTLLIWFIFLSLFLIYLKKKHPAYKNKINFVLVAMFPLFLNFKSMHLNFILHIEEQEKQKELLRIILFDFISSNLLDFLILEESMWPRLFFLFTNLSSAFISKFYRSQNWFHMDGATSIIYCYIFYLLKKSWEYNLRLIFCKSYCMNLSLSYTNQFIKELKGFHLAKNKEFISISGRDFYQNESLRIFFQTDEEKLNKNSQEEISNFKLTSDRNDKFNSFLKSMVEYSSLTTESRFDWSNFQNLDKSNSYNAFKRLGIFYSDILKDKFYEIFYRKFQINEKYAIDDVFLYDVSDHVLDKQKVQEDSNIKQRLYAKISHEFKTPLNSIHGLIEKIKDDIDFNANSEIINNLDNITNLSKYVIYLTQDIIQLRSNSNLKSLSVNKSSVNIKEVIKFGYNILVCLLRCTHNKIKTINPIINNCDVIDDVFISNDENRLKQILLNFISNAVKFTKSGNITITSSQPDSNKKRLLLSVSDTGVGISSEVQEKLFKDFSNIPNQSIDNNLGGLSICKSLAQFMGLKIFCTSQPSVGSTFSISIPCTYKRKTFSSSTLTKLKYRKKIQETSEEISLIENNKIGSLKMSTSSLNVSKDLNNFNIRHRRSFSDVDSKEKDNLNINNMVDFEEKLINRNLLNFKIDTILKNSNTQIIYENDENKLISNRVAEDDVDIENPYLSSEDSDNSENFSNRIEEKINNGLINVENKIEPDRIDKCDDEQLVQMESKINSDNNHSFDYNAITERNEYDLSIKYDLDEVYYKKGKIVIIDDNKYVIQSLNKIVHSALKDTNRIYEVISGSDGIDLLNLVREDQANGNQIKCIITDENMEYLNGSCAIKIVREWEKNGIIKPIKIFTSTCHEDKVTTKSILDSGSQLLLPKPVYVNDIIKAFRQFNV